MSVLEIGTHVGASTLHIAAALRKTAARGSSSPSLVTVDIEDVNALGGAWQRYGLRASPREMLRAIDSEGIVRFVTGSSLDFMARGDDRFDLIFLDGDHAASIVYQELPRALRLLQPGGVIVLHDYYPDRQPLWPDGRVIPGPWLAVRRLRAEGAAIESFPLGDLPWPTKQGSHTTSLAIVGRA